MWDRMGIPIAEPYIAACHMKNNSSQSQNGVFIPLQPLIEWCFEWVWALPVGNVKQLWLQHPRSTELFVVSFCTTKWPEGMSYLGIIRLHFCLFLPKGQSQSFDLTNPATTFQTRERGGGNGARNLKRATLLSNRRTTMFNAYGDTPPPCRAPWTNQGPMRPHEVLSQIFFGVMNLPYTYKLFCYWTFSLRATA